jgi:hypothetical protein
VDKKTLLMNQKRELVQVMEIRYPMGMLHNVAYSHLAKETLSVHQGMQLQA